MFGLFVVIDGFSNLDEFQDHAKSAFVLLALPPGLAINTSSGAITGTVATGAAAFIRSHWRLAFGLPLAFGLTNIIIQAYSAWIPTFMMRTFGGMAS